MNSAAVIVKQMCIMFLYMGIGFWMYKKKLITKDGSKEFANLLLFIILPAVIMNSFIEGQGSQDIRILIAAMAAGIILLLLAMLIAGMCLKKDGIANFSAAFSNAGFMGIPLIVALIGSKSVIYIAGMTAFLNILQWFYGQRILEDKNIRQRLNIKDIVFNPLVLSFVVGLFLLFTKINVPSILKITIEKTASLNAPIAMIIMGIYMAQTEIGRLFTEKKLYAITLIRLIGIPVCSIIILKYFPFLTLDVKKALLIAAAAPVGANVAVYAQKLGKDYGYAVRAVCISALFSIVSMPMCIYLAELCWK